MLAHIPTWVFGVFALLLVLGLMQSRPRAVHPSVPLLVAAGFVGYSLFGVINAFGAALVNVLVWCVGLSASIFLGRQLFGPGGLSRVDGTSQIMVPGSWVPLVLMMGIFSTKFLVGFALGDRWPIGTQAWFAPAVCLSLGVFSGGFAARAIRVQRYARGMAIPT